MARLLLGVIGIGRACGVMTRIETIEADITTLAVDVIVNAANSAMSGGGGVDGAIHRAGGPELTRAARQAGPCPTGEVRVTAGFDLPARYVIHAVGPVWRGGDHGEAELLASCYHRALAAAVELGLNSIAFPAISTGIYGYPPVKAAEVAVAAIRAFLANDQSLAFIQLVSFDKRTQRALSAALGEA